MQSGNALLVSVSGERGSGRTTLWKELETVLPKALGLPPCDFAFLPNPFEGLLHPLLWTTEQRKPPVSLLFQGWSCLEHYTETYVEPALKRCRLVVTGGFGLDTVLHSTAASERFQDDRDVLEWHLQRLVPGRLKIRGIAPPKYIVTHATPENAIADLRKSVPDLCPYAARRFIDREQYMIRSYFGSDTGQFPPLHLSGEMSLPERLDASLAFIREHLAALDMQRAA